jgi:GTP cyclohydrolase III
MFFFETGLCLTVRFVFMLREHCTQWDDSEQVCEIIQNMKSVMPVISMIAMKAGDKPSEA